MMASGFPCPVCGEDTRQEILYMNHDRTDLTLRCLRCESVWEPYE